MNKRTWDDIIKEQEEIQGPYFQSLKEGAILAEELFTLDELEQNNSGGQLNG
jgi:hypothetical protein